MVELTEKEYKEFKQLTCKHKPDLHETPCYCCGGHHYYKCSKCGKTINNDCPAHDPESDEYPYCVSCI